MMALGVIVTAPVAAALHHIKMTHEAFEQIRVTYNL